MILVPLLSVVANEAKGRGVAKSRLYGVVESHGKM